MGARWKKAKGSPFSQYLVWTFTPAYHRRNLIHKAIGWIGHFSPALALIFGAWSWPLAFCASFLALTVLMFVQGYGLMKRLTNPHVDAEIRPDLEYDPDGRLWVTLLVRQAGESAEFTVRAGWDQFDTGYSDFQPPWSPSLVASEFLLPDRPGRVRVLEFLPADEGPAGLMPVHVVGSAAGHLKHTNDQLGLRVTLIRKKPVGEMSGLLTLDDDHTRWRFEESSG